MSFLHRAISVSASLLLCTAVAFAATDQQKTQRELSHISALSSDAATRPVVNAEIAKELNTDRVRLVAERQDMSLSYGNLYLLSELLKGGAKLDDVAAQLKSGKSIADVANASKIDWKKVQKDTKDFEKKLEKSLYDSMVAAKQVKSAKAEPDAYNARADWFPFDQKSYDNDDIAWAMTTYTHAKEKAASAKGDSGLSELDYNRLHGVDHLKTDMPTPGSSTTTAPPPH